jgi:multidrug transporter EmrE-like cation transporter
MKYQLIMGTVLALLDAVSLPLFKTAYIANNNYYLFAGIMLSLVQTLMFYYSIQFSTLVVMNLLWDLLSGVSVTLVGIFIFRENMSITKLLGIALSFVSIYLLDS